MLSRRAVKRKLILCSRVSITKTYNGYSNGNKLLILFSANTYVIAFIIEFFPPTPGDQSKLEDTELASNGKKIRYIKTIAV
jgi:hypothetical protein